MNRRDLLKHSLLAATGASLSGLPGVFSRVHAATLAKSQRSLLGNDYRALVCVFLYGGNDSFNMVVPRDADHAVYADTRGALALAQNTLLPLSPAAVVNAQNRYFGLHPAMAAASAQEPSLADLFNQAGSPVAVVANVGTLLYPTTKAQYTQTDHPKPPQLYSHEDQSSYWQTPTSNTIERIGWGGLLADRFNGQNLAAKIPMSISTDGENVFQAGESVIPYFINPWGVNRIDAIHPSWQRPTDRRTALYQLLDGPLAHPLERTYAAGFKRTVDNYEEVMAALVPSETTFDGIFGSDASLNDDYFARQLKMVARIISARDTLHMQRQVFFVGLGGFDTHSNQAADHPNLLAQLARGLTRFYQATVQMGLADQVTTFTASEFGRSLTPNQGGTDHAWGGHHIVIGGAVNGGQFYGRFPSLARTNNPDDNNYGAIIPTTSVDQYAWTLARWYGLPEANRAEVFPNIARFTDVSNAGTGAPHLGFLPPAV